MNNTLFTRCIFPKPKNVFNKATLSTAIITTVMMGSLGLTGCSTVKVGKRNPAEAIAQQRTTILNSRKLSNDTQSRLLQAGLDADKCLQNMPLCVVQLKNASLSDDKGLYGAYSELYYATAQRHKAGINCEAVQKDLSTDYAKQFTDPDNNKQKSDKSNQVSCNMASQDDLLQAIRFAYIYLMFDNLPKTPIQPTNNTENFLDLPNNAILDTTSLLNNRATSSSLPRQPELSHTDKVLKGNAITRAKGIDQDNPSQNPQPTASNVQYPPNERAIEVLDLYYVAIDELGNDLYEKNLAEQYKINSNQLDVNINNQPFSEKTKSVKLVSSYQINLSKLNTISRRDGFGLNYVAVMDDRYTASVRNQVLNDQDNNLPVAERIHPLGHLPMTALLVPQGNDLASLLTTNQFKLYLYDSHQFNNINLLNKDLSLSANFSAPYGLWLKDNSLGSVSLLNLFSKHFQNSQPHLFMLEPYNPNKRVIIMLHGLGSSPTTWIGLTNDIFNDAKLRDNYQVWQVFYPTNIPILENRYEIKKLLETAFKQVDPASRDIASQHAVLIGHSMGGVIGRMLVANDNLMQAYQNIITQTPNLHDSSYRQLNRMVQNKALNDRLTLQAMPQIDRAIFISSPFRGTSYADKWFTRSLRRIISLPTGFVKLITTNLVSLYNDKTFASSPLASLFLDNGASQLSDKSTFVKLTKNIHINDNVKVNTIIATDDKDLFNALASQDNQLAQTAEDTHLNNNTDPTTPSKDEQNNSPDAPMPLDLTNKPSTNTINAASSLYTATNLDKAEKKVEQNQQLLDKVSQGATNRLSDGIVPYRSAHLEGVESEKLLSGKHNVHTSPQAILELRRILHRQLAEYGTPSDTDNKPNDIQP